MGSVQPELVPHVVAGNPACPINPALVTLSLRSLLTQAIVWFLSPLLLRSFLFKRTSLWYVTTHLEEHWGSLRWDLPATAAFLMIHMISSAALQSPMVLDHAPRCALKPYSFTCLRCTKLQRD